MARTMSLELNQRDKPNKKKKKKENETTITHPLVPGIDGPNPPPSSLTGREDAGAVGPESRGAGSLRGAVKPRGLPSRDAAQPGDPARLRAGAAWKTSTGSRNRLFFT